MTESLFAIVMKAAATLSVLLAVSPVFASSEDLLVGRVAPAASVDAPLSLNQVVLNYNTFDLGYDYRIWDGDFIDNAHGFTTGLSVSPLEHLFFQVGYSYQRPEFKLTGEMIDFHNARVGAGGYFPLFSERLHFVTALGGNYQGTRLGGGEAVKGWGFYAAPGLRWAVTDQWELSLAATYIHNDGADIWLGELGAVYAVTEGWGVRLNGGIREDAGSVGIGIRIGF